MNGFQESAVRGWIRRTFEMCDDQPLAMMGTAVFGVLGMVAGTIGMYDLDAGDMPAAAGHLSLALVSLGIVGLVMVATDWEYGYRNYQAMMARLAAAEAKELQERGDQSKFEQEHSAICEELKARFDNLALDADTRETAIDGRNELIDWHNTSSEVLEAAFAELRPDVPEHEAIELSPEERAESIALLRSLESEE